MQLKKLWSFTGKLSVLGVYILFLIVQLNLKYTFSYATGSHITSIINVDTANTKGGKQVSIQVKKLLAHQPRYNKRYLHQDPFQFTSFPKQEAVEFIVDTKPLFNQVSVLQKPELLHSFLRGPPTA